MKIYKFTILFLLTALLTSCEDVIKVDLETAAPRLVIDGSIQWQKGTLGNEQQIKLSTTTGFYDSTIPTVSGASVLVTNSDNVVFNFIETTPNTGVYNCSTFVPELDETYVLTVILNGQTYTATETLKSVSPITTIEQKNNGGLGNDIEIKSFFDDPANIENYYMFRYKSNIAVIPTFEVDDDELGDGNQNFGLYMNEDIGTGDQLDITIYGISKRYYEYMNKLLLISVGSNGPFSTPPATIRGNIINETNADNYALGYFNLSETDVKNYVIQ